MLHTADTQQNPYVESVCGIRMWNPYVVSVCAIRGEQSVEFDAVGSHLCRQTSPDFLSVPRWCL